MCLMCMRHRTLEADQAVPDDGRPEQFADMGASSSELRLYLHNNRLGATKTLLWTIVGRMVINQVIPSHIRLSKTFLKAEAYLQNREEQAFVQTRLHGEYHYHL